MYMFGDTPSGLSLRSAQRILASMGADRLPEQDVSFSKRKLIVRSAFAALALAALAYLFLPTAEKKEVQKANLEPVATGQIPRAAPPPEPQHSPQLPTADVAEPASPPIETQSVAQAPSPDTPASPHQSQPAVPDPQPASKPQTSIDAQLSSPASSAIESAQQPPSPQTTPSPPQARPVNVPPQVAAPEANKLPNDPSAAAAEKPEVL